MITAVYSGTFDPIHIGHAAIAAYISALPEIERVLMLVSPLNPLKQDSTRLFSDRQRLEMARMAMAGDSRIEVSDLESELPRPNYTVNTLNALHTTYPDIAFRLVVGADNLRDIHLWKQPEEILRRYGLIVFPRPHIDISLSQIKAIEDSYTAPGSILYLADAPVFDISSTFVRNMLASGMDAHHFVPESAYHYLTEIMNNQRC
jgi:nicotinate-nucleotide adenylyltransferase